MTKRAARLALGFLLGALFLWLSLRRVDFSRVAATLAEVDLLLLLAAFVVGQGSNWTRAWRWRLVLRRPPGTGRLFAVLMIGYFANNVLPARLGELLRVEALKRDHGIDRAEGLTSIVVEKLLDGLTLCWVLGGLLLLYDFPPWVAWIGRLSFAIFGGALLFAWLTLRHRRGVLRLARWLLHPLRRLSAPILRFVESAATGLAALGRPVILARCLLLSLATWAVEMTGAWILFRAADLDLGPLAALFVITILSLGMLVPSPPGFLGTYEYFGSRALEILGVEPSVAIAVTFLLHFQFLLATTAVGLVCLVLTSGGLRSLAGREFGDSR